MGGGKFTGGVAPTGAGSVSPQAERPITIPAKTRILYLSSYLQSYWCFIDCCFADLRRGTAARLLACALRVKRAANDPPILLQGYGYAVGEGRARIEGAGLYAHEVFPRRKPGRRGERAISLAVIVVGGEDRLSGEIAVFDSVLAVNSPQWLLSNSSNGYGDSRFTQESGFLLAVDSPLVNGGDPGAAWNDGNGTRNDIGFQGGPLGHNLGGAGEADSGAETPLGLPSALVLRSAWPNPFNPATRIELAVGRAGPVTLAIYNLGGARVATLADRVLERGIYQFRFDGSALASGPYYAHVSGPAGEHTLRLLLIK